MTNEDKVEKYMIEKAQNLAEFIFDTFKKYNLPLPISFEATSIVYLNLLMNTDNPEQNLEKCINGLRKGMKEMVKKKKEMDDISSKEQ